MSMLLKNPAKHVQVDDPAAEALLAGQAMQAVAPAKEYVFAGQTGHVGLTRLIILADAVTISASVSKVSQITTLENAKSLYWLNGLIFIVNVCPPVPPAATPEATPSTNTLPRMLEGLFVPHITNQSVSIPIERSDCVFQRL